MSDRSSTTLATGVAGGTPGRSPASRRTLKAAQRETILTAALDLAERDGAAALTMRRLGEELKIDPSTLYRLFSDKDELLLALRGRTTEITLEEIGPLDPDADWQIVLRTICDHTWDISCRYPAVTSLTFARITGAAAEKQMVELLLATLARAGLDAEQTVRYYRTITDTALSLCAQSASTQTLDPEIRDQHATAWTRIYGRVSPVDYPATDVHAQELGRISDRLVYDTAIDLIIAAIAQVAAQERP